MAVNKAQSMGFSDLKNKSVSVFDMDRLTFANKGDTERIAIMDEDAQFQMTHYINSSVKGEKGQSVVCLGDYDTVMEQGRDEANCPACVVGEKGFEVPVSSAKRRFAMHVAIYRTNAKGQAIIPISLLLATWVFGDDKFNKLIDRYQEHGDLRKKDILLTCNSGQYGTLDFDVSGKPPLYGKVLGAYKELFKQRASDEDLALLLGKPVDFEAMERLISASGVTTDPLTTDKADADDQAVVDDVMAEISDTVSADDDTVSEAAELEAAEKQVAEQGIDFDALLG